MRRIVLLAAMACAAFASPAAAWVETATYDVPGGGVADCLRAAGPGRISLLAPLAQASTPLDLLALGADDITLAPVARTDLGWLGSCPAVATAPGTPPLLLGRVSGSDGFLARALRVATPGGRPTRLPSGLVVSASAAVAPGGAAVIAWTDGITDAQLFAAVRRPGAAGFGRPALLDDGVWGWAVPATGIDAGGRATVAWPHLRTEGSGEMTLRVASAPPGGRFSAAQSLARSSVWGPELAVTPSGRALLATDAPPGIRAFERAPGTARFTRVDLPHSGAAAELSVAMNDDGGAVIGYRSDERSVFALVREPGGAFRDAGAIVPVEPPRGSSDSLFVGFSRSSRGRPSPPYDLEGTDLSAALAPDGEAVLTWVDEAHGAEAARAHAVHGTLAGGFEAPVRLGSPCRPAAAARPLPLADGTLGVTWSDNARTSQLARATTAHGAGRAHVTRPRPGSGTAQPALLPRAPKASARLVDRHPLHAAEPLRVRVSCDARCDVRVHTTARSLPQPRWAVGGPDRGGRPLALAASTALGAREQAVLTLRSLDGYDAAGVRGRPQRPIEVLVCAPGTATARRMQVAPPPIARPHLIPRVLDLTARRSARGAVRVAWRTSIPSRHARFVVLGMPGVVTARRAGHGRTRFAATLRPRHGLPLRHVTVDLSQAELRAGAAVGARVR